MKTDKDLFLEYRTLRSEESFTQLVERHRAMVLRTCLRILVNRADAEDATQVTFIELSQTPAVTNQNFAGWLHKAARDTAGDIIHKKVRSARREKEVAKMETVDRFEDLKEIREELDAAIDQLPPKLREAVILVHLEGWLKSEAAQIAGCDNGTMTRRSDAGLNRLRDILSQRTGKAVSASALLILLVHEASASGPTIALEKLSLTTLRNLEPTSQVVQLARGLVKVRSLTGAKLFASFFAATAVFAATATLYFHGDHGSSPIAQSRHEPMPPREVRPRTFQSRDPRSERWCGTYTPNGKLMIAGINGTLLVADESGTQVILRKQRAGISAVACSPDSQLLAFGDEEGTVAVWVLATRKEKFSQKSSNGEILSVAFSSDHKVLAVGHRSGTIRLLDVMSEKSEKQLRTFHGHDGAVVSVKFSPDGKKLASGGDQAINLWDVHTGTNAAKFTGHSQPIIWLAYAPDGKTLASSSWDGSVKVWDITTRKLRFTLPLAHPDWHTAVVYGPDGTLAVVGNDREPPHPSKGAIALWDVTSGQKLVAKDGIDISGSRPFNQLVSGIWEGVKSFVKLDVTHNLK